MTIEQIEKRELAYVKTNGGIWEMNPLYHGELNKYQRAKIRAFRREHGEIYLGVYNRYGEEVKKPYKLRRYTGGKVLNFTADFGVPVNDEKLKELIVEREQAPYTGTKADAERVKAISYRIAELGGVFLIWV